VRLFPSSVLKKGEPGASAVTDSERDVFKLFQKIKVEGGTALHSLRYLDAGLRPFGQVDFVLVSPKGIFVFEVKGGSVRGNDDGSFTVGDERGKSYVTKESPLGQASRNSMAVRDWLADKVVYDVKGIPVGHAVVFPYHEGVVKGMDSETEIVGMRRQCADGVTFERWVNGCIDYWWHKKGFSIDALSDTQVDEAVQLLRGKFEVEPAFDLVTGKIIELQDTLAQEQLRILDAAKQMPRLIVTGGAGSGKSFVIRTLARRYLEEGLDVGILIPRAELMALYPGFRESGGRFFVGEAGERPADILLVDEGQDLCNSEGLSLVERCVAGGIERGRWRMFLDENIQARLRGLWSETEFELLKLYASGSVLHLADNYRNTDKIVAKIILAVPAEIGRPQVGAGEACQQFEDGAEGVARVAKRLRDRGEQWSDMCAVVLGDLAEVKSALENSGIPHRDSLSDSGVLVATPEFVQGLEFRDVILYLGADRDSKTVARFYVGASRARATLTLVDPKGTYSALVESNLQ